MDRLNKRDLRQHVMRKLQEYSVADVARASRTIAIEALRDPNVLAARRVLAYRPIATFAEIDPSHIVRQLEAYADIEYVASSASAHIPKHQYDLILIPVLGYDKYGYRLGHGAGWYDRLLVSQPLAYKVGLALACSYIDELPHEPHDIKLDTILVTE